MNASNALTRQQADLGGRRYSTMSCAPAISGGSHGGEGFVGGADPSLLAMDAERVREKKLAFNRSDLL